MKRLLAFLAGVALMTATATQGLINGVTILGALLIMGSATVHYLLTSERHNS